jgi:ACT domain-containing protein
MKKTIALLAAGVLALVVLAKTTNVSSYVGTAWCKARNAVKQQVPTEFEIDRISHEIASLDSALDHMIRPIAEHKVAVDRLRKDVADDETKLNEQRKVLRDAIVAVKNAVKGEQLVYGGKSYTVAQVTHKIGLDSESFKRFEAKVAAQKKLLESKEATLHAAQEQLNGFMTKKKDFELQLAQLRAEHEVNKVAAVGNDIEIDNTPLTNIAQSLADLKDAIQRDRIILETRKGIVDVNGIQLNQPEQNATVDLEAIQAHLNGAATQKATSTVSNK